MDDIHSTVSSLTFNIQRGSQIQSIVHLIQQEAHKEGCMEPDVTLVSTAISEICRKFIEHSQSIELTLALLRCPRHINLQGKAVARDAYENSDWEKIIANLSTYFTDSSINRNSNSSTVSYSFKKTIPCR